MTEIQDIYLFFKNLQFNKAAIFNKYQGININIINDWI